MGLDLEAEVRALFREKIVEFLDWTQENWTIADQERKEDWLRDKSADYCDGYNAGVEAIKDAFKIWNDEYGP